MSTKSKKRKSHKVVKEGKPDSVKTKPLHDVVDSHDLPTDTTVVSSLSKKPVDKSLDCKSTDKVKHKSIKQSTDSSKNDINPVSTLEDDVKWCIAQLEMAAVSKTVSKKQKEECMKYIKLLQSSKTSVPRKRQIMRQNFGDYKQKIKERPLLDSDVTLKVADSGLLLSAGKFHRKSTKFQIDSTCTDENGDDEQGAVGGGSECSNSHTLRDLCRELESTTFTFNFSID